jgi:ribosomal protein L33
MKIDGTVTISLDTYQKLIDHSKDTDKLKDNTKRAAKEMSVFLSFLCTRSDIKNYVDEFNRQSTTASIEIKEGRATITFKNDKNKI